MADAETRLHYFDDETASPSDTLLKMMIQQGYVPATCLLGGRTVWSEISGGFDPCSGCNGPREKCHGAPKERGSLWTLRPAS